MKSYIIFIVLLLPFKVFSQVIEEMPIDVNGMINFNEVIEVEGLSKNQLYLNSKEFFVNGFKSAKDVIQLDDKDDAIIIGKAYSDIVIQVLGLGTAIKLYYTIKIQSRDGRFKYEIYDLFFKSYPNPQVPVVTTQAETMFESETYYKGNGKPKKIQEQYKDQTLLTIESLRSSIINSMNKSEGNSNDDW